MVHEQNTEIQKPKVYVFVFVCFLTLPIPTALASLEAQMVKNLPAVQETWVQSLGQEDPLEKGTATHSRILAWRISRTQEPGGLQSMGSQRVGHNWLFLSTMEGLLHEGRALPQGSKIIAPIIWTWTWHLTTLGFAEFWGWQLLIERHKQYIGLRKIFGVMSNSLLTSSKCWKIMVSKYEQNQLRLRNFLKEIWVNE